MYDEWKQLVEMTEIKWRKKKFKWNFSSGDIDFWVNLEPHSAKETLEQQKSIYMKLRLSGWFDDVLINEATWHKRDDLCRQSFDLKVSFFLLFFHFFFSKNTFSLLSFFFFGLNINVFFFFLQLFLTCIFFLFFCV